MKSNSNKVLVPDSKGYVIDLESHEMYNSRGKKMKPFVDIRGRVSTKIIMETGSQRTIVVKDLVRKLKGLESKRSKRDAIELEDYNHKVIEANTYLQILTHYDEIMTADIGRDRYDLAKELTEGVDLHILRRTMTKISK